MYEITPFFCAVLSCALLITGCSSGDGLDRIELRGKVTVDGELLKNGTISFYPTGAGPVVGTEIEDGTFYIPRSQGPIAGEYRVEIDSVGPTGRRITNSRGQVEDEYESMIPPKFNRQSKLLVTLQTSGSNDQLFELTSKASTSKKP